MLLSFKEILEAQKALLAAYKDRLDGVVSQPVIASRPLEQIVPSPVLRDEESEQKKREILAAEKTEFEKDVQEKKKNMDWYEKEFRIALSALFDRPLPPYSSRQAGGDHLQDACQYDQKGFPEAFELPLRNARSLRRSLPRHFFY
jgi:hypothetical protein